MFRTTSCSSQSHMCWQTSHTTAGCTRHIRIMQQVADVSTLSHRSASTAVCTVRAPSSSATECLMRADITFHQPFQHNPDPPRTMMQTATIFATLASAAAAPVAPVAGARFNEVWTKEQEAANGVVTNDYTIPRPQDCKFDPPVVPIWHTHARARAARAARALLTCLGTRRRPGRGPPRRAELVRQGWRQLLHQVVEPTHPAM